MLLHFYPVYYSEQGGLQFVITLKETLPSDGASEIYLAEFDGVGAVDLAKFEPSTLSGVTPCKYLLVCAFILILTLILILIWPTTGVGLTKNFFSFYCFFFGGGEGGGGVGGSGLQKMFAGDIAKAWYIQFA